MKLTDLWKTKKTPTLSFELFPARNEKAAQRLDRAIDTLAGLNPDFVSVTFGAGGSTKEGSYQLIEKLIRDKGLNVLGYFAAFGLGPDEITAILNSYQALGLQNILAVRGDEPRELDGFEPHPQSLSYASDLVTFISSRYDFCLGAAGYPESHIDAQSKAKDIDILKLKVDNGAEFIITNYFYDNHFFFDFLNRCQAAGIKVPILPGIMPIYSIKMMETLAGLCGATITEDLRKGLAVLPEDDKKAINEFGIEFAANQCEELLNSGVIGLHVYTMDRSSSTVGIVHRLRTKGVL